MAGWLVFHLKTDITPLAEATSQTSGDPEISGAEANGSLDCNLQTVQLRARSDAELNLDCCFVCLEAHPDAVPFHVSNQEISLIMSSMNWLRISLNPPKRPSQARFKPTTNFDPHFLHVTSTKPTRSRQPRDSLLQDSLVSEQNQIPFLVPRRASFSGPLRQNPCRRRRPAAALA